MPPATGRGQWQCGACDSLVDAGLEECGVCGSARCDADAADLVTDEQRQHVADVLEHPERYRRASGGFWICPDCRNGNGMDVMQCACGCTKEKALEAFRPYKNAAKKERIVHISQQSDAQIADDIAGAAKGIRQGLLSPDPDLLPAGKKNRRSGAGSRSGAGLPPAGVGWRDELPVTSIDPSPTNPRKTFDQAKLAELADSLKAVGLIEPLVVRPVGPRYELIAGERRWRAAKLAKLPAVPVRVLDVTDQEAAELQLRENIERQDLNPIEEAHAFKHLVSEGMGYNQTTLAKRLGVTQGHVSNRLRLLELPEAWQERVISEEITIAEARELVPWCEFPAVLAQLAKGWKKGDSLDWPLRKAVRDVSRTMREHTYSETARVFSLPKDPKAREELWGRLQVRTLEGEDRALNVALWDELNAEAEAKRAEREEKAAARASKPGKNGEPALSSAERKKRAEKQRQIYAKRLHRYRVQWLQAQIVERLPNAEAGLLLKLVLHFAAGDGQSERLAELMESVAELGGSVKRTRATDRYHDRVDWIGAFSKLGNERMGEVMVLALARWLKHDVERWGTDLYAEDVEAVAKEMGVDPRKHWVLDEEFLSIHNREQLLELAEEWRMALGLRADAKRSEVAAGIKRDWVKGCPQRLLEVKASGARPAGTAGEPVASAEVMAEVL